MSKRFLTHLICCAAALGAVLLAAPAERSTDHGVSAEGSSAAVVAEAVPYSWGWD